MLVLEDLVNFSFFSITSWDIDLDYCNIEWFAFSFFNLINALLASLPSVFVEILFCKAQGLGLVTDHWKNHSLDYIDFCWQSDVCILTCCSLVAQRLKRLPARRETGVQSLGREDPLEKEMATHSSTLAWRIPWREEPGRLQSMGSQRVGHD